VALTVGGAPSGLCQLSICACLARTPLESWEFAVRLAIGRGARNRRQLLVESLRLSVGRAQWGYVGVCGVSDSATIYLCLRMQRGDFGLPDSGWTRTGPFTVWE